MKGCLLVHGFTGSPQEVLPLARHLQKRTDWWIEVPTLPGHGEGESLHGVTWQDWLVHAEKSFIHMQQRCEQVMIIGFSMGGLISAYLASQYQVEKLVLLSTSIFCINPRQMAKDLQHIIKERIWKKKPFPGHLQRYKRKIRETPLQAVIQFRSLVKGLTPVIGHIDVPVLIIQGVKDHVVEPRSAQYIYDHVRSEQKEIMYLPESKHLVCCDCEQRQMFTKVEGFLVAEKSLVKET